MADPFTLNDSDYIQTEPWPVPKSVFIIAEVGINHNGDIDIAKQLIYNAKSSGCDAVKFQKRTIDIVYTPEMLDQFRESPWGKTQRKQKEGIELSEAEYDEIEAYCKKLEIDWFASAWDIPSQHFLSKYGLKYNKVASAMTDEAFMTGTPFCMLPVTSLDGLPIGNGKIGPVFGKLLAAWSKAAGVDVAGQIKGWDAARGDSSSQGPTPYQFK